jgi:hypothetical protein
LCKKYIVKKSIPIVHFGNLEKYKHSKRKIVTIGLNPLNNEFTEKIFDIIDFKKGDEKDNVSRLSSTLNRYFEVNPYNKWFYNGEFVLNVVGATYYENPVYDMGFENYDTAVHIDIYSSIATDPTWGKLDVSVKNELQNITLFKELLKYLNPNVILVSVNKDIFNQCFYEYSFVEARFQNKDLPSMLYIKKYVHSDGTQLLWLYNNHGKAFGLSHDFTKNNVPEMIL